MIRSTTAEWGWPAKLLHWLGAAFILVLLIHGWWMTHLAARPDRLANYGWHAAIGYDLMGLLVLRLLWRWANPVPALPGDLKPWERTAAHLGHFGLYLLMLATTLTGWAMAGTGRVPLRQDLLGIELPLIVQSGAVGIGLLRTEFLFMNRETIPDEDTQTESYRSIVEAMHGDPVSIRVLDWGGEKEIEALTLAGITESGLQQSKYRNPGSGDRDSVGFLQQRPSQGWGPAGESASTDAGQFLDAAIKANKGFHGSAGQLAQAVQRSAYPGRYDQHSGEADKILQGVLGATQAPSDVNVTTHASQLGASPGSSTATSKAPSVVDIIARYNAGTQTGDTNPLSTDYLAQQQDQTQRRRKEQP